MDPVDNTNKNEDVCELAPQSTISPREEAENIDKSADVALQDPCSSNDLSRTNPISGKQPTQRVKPNIATISKQHPAELEPPKLPLPKKSKELFSACGNQWIRREYPATKRKRIDLLGLSARFRFVTMDVKLHNEGCIMATDDNFVAQVRVDSPELLDGIGSFEDAKEVLFERMQIVKVMRDDLLEERDELRAELIPVIREALKDSTVKWEHARNFIQLFKLRKDLIESDRLSYRRLCREISTNQAMTEDLRKFAKKLLNLEETALKRSKWLDRFGLKSDNPVLEDLNEELRKVLKDGLNNHRRQLIALAPKCIEKPLNEANQNKMMLINGEDIRRFGNLIKDLNNVIFKKLIEDLAVNWLNSISTNHSIDRPQLTNSVFFHLCKSLENLIVEISARSGNCCKMLLFSDLNGWHPADSIKWKYENCLTTCLEFEYRYIFKLLEHFSFIKQDRKPFHYYPLVVNRFSKSAHINETKRLIKYHTTHKNPFKIPDEYYIWYSMVDVVLSEMSVGKTKPWGKIDRLGPIFWYYTEMIKKTQFFEVNEIRKISHTLVRYIVLNDQVNNQSLSNLHNQETKKFCFTYSETWKYSACFVRCLTNRNIMFCFWVEGLHMLNRISHLPGFKQLYELFLEIDSIVCTNLFNIHEVEDFYTEINIFVKFIVEMQLEWCKKEPNSEKIYFEIENNSWEPLFQKITEFLDSNARKEYLKRVSKQYELKSIKQISSTLQRLLHLEQWTSSGESLDKLDSATNLLKIVNRIITVLPKTDNIPSFDVFYEKLVEPLHSAVENGTSVNSFLIRLNEIANNFPKSPTQTSESSEEKSGELMSGVNVSAENICWVLFKLIWYFFKILERWFIKMVMVGIKGMLYLISFCILLLAWVAIDFFAKTYICKSNDYPYWNPLLTFFGFCSEEANAEARWFNGRYWEI